MEVAASTRSGTVKRVRPSAKAALAKSAPMAEAPVVKKKTASPRKSTAVKPALPVPEVLVAMISTAAYYRAATRGFAPGQEMQDWLEAEQQILSQY